MSKIGIGGNMEHLSHVSYLDVVAGSHKGAIREVEVPIGHSLSLPIPTLKFGIPAYAAFASPAVREPEQPVVQGPPDRWWLMDARNGALALFAYCNIYPFTQEHFTKVALPRPVGAVAELRQNLVDIQRQIEVLAPVFFCGEEGEAEARHHLHQALKLRIPAVLWPQYQAIATDFLAWLSV